MKIIDLDSREVYEIYAPNVGENYLQCPKCSPTRRKKREKCLTWNSQKEVGFCHHCKASFALYKPLQRQQEKVFAVPQWENKTELTDRALQWFTGRMISQSTLVKMRVFSDEEFLPQYGKHVEVICFPYFRGGQLVNIKFRGPGKKFKLVKDAELIFYNLDCLLGKPESVIIVEGEIDALSWVEAGYDNVLSVPNGASGNDLSFLDAAIDELSQVKTVYIAADHDEPGIKLRNELVRRLGPERTRIVTYGGHKDTNELFIAGGTAALREALKNAYPPPLRGVLDLSLHYDEIRVIFEQGLDSGQPVGLETVDELVKWRTGLLAVWTGIPSHGKSEILNFMAVRWCVQLGWKVAFFSPENMPYPRYLYPKLASVIAGRPFRRGFISEETYDEVFDFVCDNFKFIDGGDDYSVEGIISAAEGLVRRYGIKVLVIDPYNCFEHTKRSGESETEYIGRFLDTLARFAKRYDVLVNLVAHPRKMERLSNKAYMAPSLYDISGSANFYNKADIGITIYRRFPDNPKGPATEFTVTKVRFKELGSTGTCELQYNYQNGRYAVPVEDVRFLDNGCYLSSRNDTDGPSDDMPYSDASEFNSDDCPF